MLDEQSGVRTEGNGRVGGGDGTKRGLFGIGSINQCRYPGTGGASRFFYVAKASRREREAGLNGARCPHPTVKPLALMRYLVRLTATPTGGVVLDPFMGSGTTGCACALEGRGFIGIEKEAEYVEIARARIAHWAGQRQPAVQGELL
jgi:DNA modification methylase